MLVKEYFVWWDPLWLDAVTNQIHAGELALALLKINVAQFDTNILRLNNLNLTLILNIIIYDIVKQRVF